MNSKKNLKRNLLICLLAGSAVMYTLPLHAATSVIGNTTLPGNILQQIGGVKPERDNVNHVLDVTQSNPNAFIKWDSFDVGGSATVNFDYTGQTNFNTLNYVNSGAASQIYGTINAQHGTYNGNIFIVNPAGVQIGNSAQINVGSLYVSNQNLDTVDWSSISANTDVNTFLNQYDTHTNAELMSLGNINATEVTFEGDGRIVIDGERLKDVAGTEKLTADKIFVNTKDKNNVVIGYDAYENGSYAKVDNTQELVTLNDSEKLTKADGYMWVEDVEQLQAINTNLSGNYALRNSIDATSTEQQGNEFSSIGITSAGNVDNNEEGFTGKFDGLDYSIFDLNIDETGNDNVGLFGYTTDATISNVTLVGGSIRGNNNVGAVVGNANNTTVTNALNSAAVSGNSNVGGIVGSATNTTVEDAINTGAIEGRENTNGGSNVGGLIGSMDNSHLIGNSYNLGDVTSIGSNVGGLVGYATNSVIGNEADIDTEETDLVYNRMDVTGAYNVGGIVGNMVGSTVRNAENSGTVTAERYTTEKYNYHTANGGTHIESVDVNVANVGGIAGKSSNKSTIENVTNTANVSSKTNNYEQYGSQHEYYTAGNAGGIVGRAEDTDITNATNRENEVCGAHNVGGVAGYFGGSGKITTGINDGGDIMATGARNDNEFVKEAVRPIKDGANETFIIGNIGGIVGYLDGDNVFVTASANRGTVHSQDISEANADKVLDISKAANVGGIVGKIDRGTTDNLKNDNNEIDVTKAAVSNSYNTGDVRGYTGVGGVVGMMYNGEVAGSYNLGYISTTRQSTTGGSIDALNMGGIVGDTTELSGAEVYLYDVYNKGQIGDSEFNYFGRHVGGIVGRLSGTVEKAYNNGAIYNGYNVVGGIAGWMAQGKIENAFNTGNITVLNKNNAQSQVGGIVGAANVATESIEINNVYNLGTLRSFRADSNSGVNTLGGIIGQVNEFNGNGANTFTISNAYTTGNLMMYKLYGGSYVEDLGGDEFVIAGTTYTSSIGSIYGSNTIGTRLNVSNAYYIKPAKDEDGNPLFTELSGNSDNSNKAIEFGKKDDSNEYKYNKDGQEYKLEFSTQVEGSGNVEGNTDNNWRIYDGNTPILNAFLPDSEKYFADNGLTDNSNNTDKTFNGSIQYGTAYDPLLTIINTDRDLVFNFGTEDNELSITNAAGLAVYGGGVTLNNFTTSGGSGYFGGTIYADGALNLNGGTNDIGLGSAADIYGSAVNITTGGKVTIYGDVTATGNTANGATSDTSDVIDVKDKGNITISASDVDVYGTLTSASNNTQDATVKIPGIQDSAVTWTPGEVNNPNAEMADIADRFAHTIGASAVDGNITINAKGTPADVDGDGKIEADEVTGGNVGLYYGNKGEGITTTGGNLSVTGTGDVYVDSDLDIGGDLMLEGTGADSEVVLDISNIGQVQADNGTVGNALTGLHNFLNHFADADNSIELDSESGDAKLAVDMWDETANNNQGAYNLDKFNNGNDSFADKLDGLNLTVNGTTIKNDASAYTYIWVNDADQLNGIQNYYDTHAGTNILNYNFALKNDINASDLTDFNVIGTNADDVVIGYSGTFDGRGNRIIGLEVDNESNAGIFSQINQTGTVKNLNVYSGTFTGSSTAGAIAGINNGTIENITAFGNTVTVTGDGGNAGGIAGTNSGTVDDVESSGSVIAESDNVIVGGLVGTNESGATVNNSYSNSAATSTSGTDAGLGGVVGVNKGTVSLVDSLGVTNGTNSTKVGGVIGINSGTLSSAYNESIVNGYSNVGGIIGDNANTGTVSNIVNATSVTGENESADNGSQYVGGLVGSNSGSVTNGRNNGTITGTNYVGGMVGSNAQGATLTNLVNDSSAAIEGENFVGGIAGTNAGTITAQNQSNLINRGSITGQNYVGGVAGENIGTIEYVKNDVNLYVKDDTKTAQYFGGVAGINGRDDDTSTTEDETATGTITSATNEGDVVAENAQYVGGIVGWNTVNGILDGMGNSNTGRVEGATYVGGVAGKNDADITGDVDNIVTIENTGVVIAHNGGAGGIFGENTGDIQYAEMSNSGIVSGTNYSGSDDVTNGTGGIIGVNSGDITYSSITNTVDGQVTGINNVGGLIGYNTGTIIGGRNEAQETGEDGNVTAEKDSYYKYQVYNNGTITVTGSGSNIGGLIGENAAGGSLTAGYNTGAINAESSSNVGGIAGSNAGTIGEVFNTVYNTDGNKGVITGGTNVGGLVGENTNNGTLSNAYNTTEVVGTLDNAVVGNAVGVNSGTISNIYATNTTGQLIGSGYDRNVSNAYSFSANEVSGNNVIVISDQDDQKDSGSYAGFDFTNGTWKNYDGSGNPLLKVFLTDVEIKVDVDKINEYINNVYNGDAQYITDEDIDKLIAQGAITAPDNFTAYKNAKELINSISHTNAGTYNDWLYSGQIASSGTGETFNPNNLGYDIVLTADIDKATINISLKDIYRTYGDIYNIYSDAERTTETTYDGSYTIDTSNLNDVLQQYIKDNLQVVELSSDGSLTGDGKTQNVGDYNWSLKFTLVGDDASNYQINSSDSVSDVVVTGEKKAHVEKANLTITLDEVIRNYGSTLITNNGGDYSATISGLVNGDDELGYTSDDLDITVTGDGALTGSSTGRVTNNAGDYTWSATVTGVDNGNLTNLSNNYNITVNGTGKSTVKKVQLTVDLDEVTRTYGNTVITNNNGEYSISNIQGLVNGDADLGYDVDDLVINVTGDTALTGNSTGEVTQDANGDYTWSATVSGKDGDLTNLSTNYEIVTTGTGKSTVNKADLIININDVETTYGTAFDESKYGYGFGNNGANGLVNGDVLEDVKDAIDSAAGGYYNSGAADGTNGKVTQDAEGDYSLSFNNELTGTNTLKNYNIITVNNGDSTVNKKQITIGANDEQILVGETPNYSGTDIDSVLVNGDSLNGNYHYGVADGTIESVAGTHTGVIGVWIGGVFYDLSQNVDWTQAGSFFSNYEVNYTPGTLTVSAYDIPEDWPHNRWDYLFNDAPFDRNKDFRERKAEVNFVDGGMEI